MDKNDFSKPVRFALGVEAILKCLTAWYGLVYAVLFVLLLFSGNPSVQNFLAGVIPVIDLAIALCWYFMPLGILLSFFPGIRPVGGALLDTGGRIAAFFFLSKTAMFAYLTLGPAGLIVGTLCAFFGIIPAAIIGQIYVHEIPTLMEYLRILTVIVSVLIAGQVILSKSLPAKARRILEQD